MKKIRSLLFIAISLSFVACSAKYVKNEDIKSLHQEVSYNNVSKDSSRDSYGVVHAVDNTTIYGVDKNDKWSSLTKSMFSFGMSNVGKEAVAVSPGKHTFYVAYNNRITPSGNMRLIFDVKKESEYASFILPCLIPLTNVSNKDLLSVDMLVVSIGK